jgi:hypothetical protein
MRQCIPGLWAQLRLLPQLHCLLLLLPPQPPPVLLLLLLLLFVRLPAVKLSSIGWHLLPAPILLH